MHQVPILMCIFVITKYIQAGVITGATEIWSNNNIETKYPEPNAIIKQSKLQKPMPTKYWTSKNIPLFKKIPKGFAENVNKYPDSFYKELYGISKVEDKVKNRVHELMKTNIDSDLNNAHDNFVSVEEKINKDNIKNFEDIVEVSISDYDTTEDTNIGQEAPEDNQKLLKEFIKSQTVIPTKSDCHSDSSEEKKDLDEFIFVLDSQIHWEDVIDDGSVEMTTQVFAKPRSKRKVNMIEEENMGTTVSGFKFTGQDTGLNNDLYFKNINS